MLTFWLHGDLRVWLSRTLLEELGLAPGAGIEEDWEFLLDNRMCPGDVGLVLRGQAGIPSLTTEVQSGRVSLSRDNSGHRELV